MKINIDKARHAGWDIDIVDTDLVIEPIQGSREAFQHLFDVICRMEYITPTDAELLIDQLADKILIRQFLNSMSQ